jgi:hypothetical protein
MGGGGGYDEVIFKEKSVEVYMIFPGNHTVKK